MRIQLICHGFQNTNSGAVEVELNPDRTIRLTHQGVRSRKPETLLMLSPGMAADIGLALIAQANAAMPGYNMTVGFRAKGVL